jgi:nitric oxide reductase subunit B
MLTQPLPLSKTKASNSHIQQGYTTDKMALAFLALALSYLALGLLFGLLGSMQYLLPPLLKDHLGFQKTRPLHVYLVISWIFTAAQGGLYYYVPRIAHRDLYWQGGVKLHWLLQAITSLLIVVAFFNGSFGGREYLEFPPLLGLAIAIAWLPFAINFFLTLKPRLANAPVYFFSWTLGIAFFYITLAESYLWVFDYFSTNEVRDITVQWKALGSMVGSWNMLVYGTSMYIMEKMKGDTKMSRSPMAFFFFFLGFTNLLFNWGHHTYIVPAAHWVKTVAYVISMTELLIFGKLLLQWRKTISSARKNFHILPFRFLSYADWWIFLNLGVAILISIPQLNYYTHGTHITVAHAMGTTIGINTMLLFASVVYILQQQKPQLVERYRGWIAKGGAITNIALIFFWSSLVGSGLVKMASKLHKEAFHTMMQKSQPFFKLFAFSGIFIWLGVGILILATWQIIWKKEEKLIS